MPQRDPQNRIVDHVELFQQSEYQEMFQNKRQQFEKMPSPERVQEVAEWTKTWEYREKNFAREALTVNPSKGCQPLGAIFAAVGFETYIGNLRELKRILGLMGIEYTILADNSDILDMPNTGEYRMYAGGTKLEDAADSINSQATICLQRYPTNKTRDYIEQNWNQPTKVLRPWGVKGTDEFLMALLELTGKPVPQELEDDRGRLLDAMTDSTYWVHGKKFAIFGDPDTIYGTVSFLLELGAEPVHILCNNGDEEFQAEMQALLKSSPFGQKATVWIKKDLWHMRSLLFTEPVDLIIGNSYGKYLWRDTKIPMVRVGFPIFDRHHLHRDTTIAYQGALNLLKSIVNTILEELDRNTFEAGKTDISFDLVR